MNPTDITYNIIFYMIAAVSIGGAIVVVTTRRILRAAVALTFVLLGSAAFYIMLDYDFIAGIQVLVYVGGIVILIVFAVMLTSSLEIKEAKPQVGRKLMGLGAAVLFFTVTMAALVSTEFNQTMHVTPDDLASEIGRKLLNFDADGFVLPFELISLLLLSAAIGSIVIARSGKDEKPGAVEIHGIVETPLKTEDTEDNEDNEDNNEEQQT